MPFAIALERPKAAVNVGTLLRTCFNFGCAAVFTVGQRYPHFVQHPGDTVKAYRHIPLLHFATWTEYREHAPHSWEPIGVEITREATSLFTLCHPHAGVYVLGPEDGSLSAEAKALCRRIVYVPSRLCLNLAVAGAVVMYDRAQKEALARCESGPMPLPRLGRRAPVRVEHIADMTLDKDRASR